jgi:hypothetical protein
MRGGEKGAFAPVAGNTALAGSRQVVLALPRVFSGRWRCRALVLRIIQVIKPALRAFDLRLDARRYRMRPGRADRRLLTVRVFHAVLAVAFLDAHGKIARVDLQRFVVLFDDGIDNMPFSKWKRRHSIEHGGESGKVIGLFGDNQFTNSKPLPPPLPTKNVKPDFPHQPR